MITKKKSVKMILIGIIITTFTIIWFRVTVNMDKYSYLSLEEVLELFGSQTSYNNDEGVHVGKVNFLESDNLGEFCNLNNDQTEEKVISNSEYCIDFEYEYMMFIDRTYITDKSNTVRRDDFHKHFTHFNLLKIKIVDKKTNTAEVQNITDYLNKNYEGYMIAEVNDLATYSSISSPECLIKFVNIDGDLYYSIPLVSKKQRIINRKDRAYIKPDSKDKSIFNDSSLYYVEEEIFYLYRPILGGEDLLTKEDYHLFNKNEEIEK